MDLKELCQKSHKTAREHGFWEEKDNPLIIPTKLALIGSEVSEALEAHRNRDPIEMLRELADILIRLTDLIGWCHTNSDGVVTDGAVDIFESILEEKMAYNKTRPHKHGKRY